MSLKICPACGHKVSKKAKTCPNCGHPVESFWTKKRSSLWIFIGIFLIIVAFPKFDNIQDTPTSTVKSSNNKQYNVQNKKLTQEQKEKILQLVKSESKVKDAIFPNSSDSLLYVGVYNDGTRKDGFAEYLCLSINQKVKLPHQIYIKIVDYQDILQKKGFREIGSFFCKPIKIEKVKSIDDI